MTRTELGVATLPTLPTLSDVLGAAADACETVPLGAGLEALVAHRPGHAWNVSTHRRVYEALVPVTSSAFGADMTGYWAGRNREGYLERLFEFVLVRDADGRMVGWTGFHLLPHDEHMIVYIDSTGMVPQRQSRGAMRELMRSRLIGTVLPACPPELPVYLTARTESPIFYRLMRGLLGGGDELFPQPGTPAPADVRRCGLHLADWLGQRRILDPATLTLTNAYDSVDELYGELPTTGDPALDELFRARLGPLDAFLLVGRAR